MATRSRPGTGGGDTDRKATTPAQDGGSGNRGADKKAGDEVGAGTRIDGPASPEDLTRGAPPKKKKRYSLAD